MPRTLSPAAAQAILARETAVVFLSAMRITHPDLVEPIRIVNNTEPVQRAEGQYVPWSFEALLPDDTEQAINAHVDVTIDNVDRRVSRIVRSLSGVRPQVSIEIIIADQPDVVERGPFDFSVLSVDTDVMTLRLSLGHEEDILNQAVPAQSYSPTNSPGMYI